MPERTPTRTTSKIQAGGGPQPQPQTRPCGQDRNPLDVVGRVNDLINCYLASLGDYFRVYLPLALVAVILVAVMIFAAYSFIKE